jgi:hypothetical protein
MEGTRYHSGTTKWTAKTRVYQPVANLDALESGVGTLRGP